MNPAPLQTQASPPYSVARPAVTLAITRRRAFKLALSGASLMLLGACGQRGPLYMPDPNDPTKKRS